MLVMNRLLCAVVLVAGCANHAKQSVSLYEAGDYAGAARAADDGLAKHPDDDGLWGMRVRAALAHGRCRRRREGVRQLPRASRRRRQRAADATSRSRRSARRSPRPRSSSRSRRSRRSRPPRSRRSPTRSPSGWATTTIASRPPRRSRCCAAYPQAPQVAEDMLKSEDPEARRIAVDGIGRKVGKLAAADLEKAGERSRSARAPRRDPLARPDQGRGRGRAAARAGCAIPTRACAPPRRARSRGSASATSSPLGRHALGDHALAVRLAGIELLVAAKRTDEPRCARRGDPDPMVAIEAAIAVEAPRSRRQARSIAPSPRRSGRSAPAPRTSRCARSAGTGARELAQRLVADTELARPPRRRARARSRRRRRRPPPHVFAAALASPDFALQAAADLADQRRPARPRRARRGGPRPRARRRSSARRPRPRTAARTRSRPAWSPRSPIRAAWSASRPPRPSSCSRSNASTGRRIGRRSHRGGDSPPRSGTSSL